MRPNPGIVVLPLLALAVVLACHPKTPPTPPTPHSVTLTWKAPNLPAKVSLVGYNIYRWTTKDSRYLKIATQVPGPPYEDRQVVSGETYFYAVTAVDQKGRESRLSENIQATIP
jgi:fibronectin type 3 domain-containing protein